MLRKTLDKIFSSRVFYIIFALLASIVLWMFVEISENRLSSHSINVPVVLRNNEVLRDRGLLISEINPQTVALTFEVSRAVASRLTNATVFVEVDMANVIRTGHEALPFEIVLPSDVSRNDAGQPTTSVARIQMTISRLASRPIPVRVEYGGGTASDDLFAEPVEFNPRTITVSGPEDVITRINHARVRILMDNLSSIYVDDLGFVLIDDYGEELDEDQLEAVDISHDTIRVTIPIRQVKDVPLRVELIHGAGSSESNSTWTADPPLVTVSGDPEALRDFNYIMLGSVNMTGFTNLGNEAFAIIVPSHLRNESGEALAHVRVEVLLDFIDLRTDNLFVINTPPGHWVDMVTTSLVVSIRGMRENLDLITDMSIRAVADVRDLSPGPHRVPVRVYVDGVPDVGAVGDYRFSLRIIPDPS
jgi:YbbR domain-containing protein